jgi:hypothetical protein
MKLASKTRFHGSSDRWYALLWLLLVAVMALNYHLIGRGFVQGGGRGSPIEDFRDLPESLNDHNNVRLSNTEHTGEEGDEVGARRGGVTDDVHGHHQPLKSRISRKEGGDMTGILVDDGSGDWGTSAKRLQADREGEVLFTTNSNVPGVPHLYGYVEAYWDSMVNTRMVDTLEEASKMYVSTFALARSSSPGRLPFSLAHSLASFSLIVQAGVDDRSGYGDRRGGPPSD